MAVPREGQPIGIAKPPHKFPLRDQAQRGDERVAGQKLLRAAVQTPQRHAADPPLAMDRRNSRAAAYRDLVRLDAAAVVARHAAVTGFLLDNGDHMLARQHELPGHDQPQIPASEDQHFPSEVLPAQVHHLLRLPGGEDPGGTRARHGKGADAPLATAGGQDQAFKMQFGQAAAVGQNGGSVAADPQHLRAEGKANAGVRQPLRDPVRVFRAAQLHAVSRKPEAFMQALRQNAAGLLTAVDKQDIPTARLPGGESRRDPGRARADDQKLSLHADRLPTPRSPRRPW